MIKNHPVYFAASNTLKGFQNHFTQIFDAETLRRIYIIKGGPGTGKSSLMRFVAAKAEEAGLSVERFPCSSDPASLDGVLLPEKGIALVDGTSPHTLDPAFPGVVESIVNTGSFWNTKTLLSKKREIMDLIRDGKKHYKRAYGFLSAIGEITEAIRRLTSAGLDQNKMDAQVSRLEKRVFEKHPTGMRQIRVLSTFNKNGIVHLPGFLPDADRVWLIRDPLLQGTLFLDRIAKRAAESKQSFTFCPSCLFPGQPEALFFSAAKTAFVIENENYVEFLSDKEVHVIHMQRFNDRDVVRANSQKLRFGKRCVATLSEGAAEAFQDAARAHAELEKYYITAMDFTGLSRYTDSLAKEILSD